MENPGTMSKEMEAFDREMKMLKQRAKLG